MAGLIYKQWHRQPNRKNTPVSNGAHIKYISCREHVLKKDGALNGLFGTYDSNKWSDEIDIDNAMGYVHKMSKKGITVFRSTVSFKAETAKLLELDSLEKWEKYVKYHVASIAKENGIKMQNFEYLAAMHDKKGQPHLHIVFWDTDQGVGKNIVSPLVGDTIRKEITLKTFKPQMNEFGAATNEFSMDSANKVRTGILKGTFENELNLYISEATNSFRAVTERSDKAILNNKVNAAYKKLYDMLPQTGSLKFAVLSAEIKEELLKFADVLIANNEELNKEYNHFLENKSLLADMYNSADTNFGKKQIATIMGKATDQVKRKIANRILAALKTDKIECRTKEYEDKKRAEMLKTTPPIIISDLIHLFSSSNKTVNDALPAASEIFGNGEMTKEAIKEYIRQKEDKTNEYTQ